VSGYRLGQLAEALGVRLRGDTDKEVTHVATLLAADDMALSFLSNRKYAHHLADSHAGVVILTQEDAIHWQGNALIVDNPYLVYAKAAALLHPQVSCQKGVHPSAIIDASAQLAVDVAIGAHVVIGANVIVGANSVVCAGCVIDHGVVLGSDCLLGANVTILHGCVLGDRVVVESGSVIGSEGFGWAKDGVSWVKIPQVGRVVIGNDVSIGANTCIDRGAIDDTIIENGVKIDNLIQIAHNVRIGEHTAMAANSAIAGSTKVGSRCTIAGKVGIAGHLTVCDDVHITAMTMISHDLNQAGVYSGAIPQDKYANWRRNAARFRQLDAMAKRLRALEKRTDKDFEGASGCISD
jgi:UDP-3-O-[3-hydroxymyristoyl] glucosamine N-acyltransferase